MATLVGRKSDGKRDGELFSHREEGNVKRITVYTIMINKIKISNFKGVTGKMTSRNGTLPGRTISEAMPASGSAEEVPQITMLTMEE